MALEKLARQPSLCVCPSTVHTQESIPGTAGRVVAFARGGDVPFLL